MNTYTVHFTDGTQCKILANSVSQARKKAAMFLKTIQRITGW